MQKSSSPFNPPPLLRVIQERHFCVPVRLHRPTFSVTQDPATPEFIDGWGLVDTGATKSAVCRAKAELLGYVPVSFGKHLHAEGESNRPVYALNFEMVGVDLKAQPPRDYGVGGVDLSRQSGVVMLLGMDALSLGELFMNGPSGSGGFSIPARPFTFDQFKTAKEAFFQKPTQQSPKAAIKGAMLAKKGHKKGSKK